MPQWRNSELEIKNKETFLLFLWSASSGISESFSEWIVVDLELSDLLVLVGRDPDELGLLEDVRPERRVGQLQDVVGADQVKAWLVLVHGVQDCLK